MSMRIISAQEAIGAFGQGEFVIIIDDARQGGVGDLVISAECADAHAINFMMTHARGSLCIALPLERLRELSIPPVPADEDRSSGPNFHVSVDARTGVHSGMSAADRATTLRKLIAPDAKPSDFVRPGHMQTLAALNGGVLKRVGHTEAAIDLARLAELTPAAVMATVLDSEGNAAEADDLGAMAREYNIGIVSLTNLIRHRRQVDRLVQKQAEADLPTQWGEFRIYIYTSLVDNNDYIALVKGDLSRSEPPLVRVHSGCVTGDVLGSLKCDCRQQLHSALERIQREGHGVLLYIPGQEGRGIGLANKIRAYHLQDEGYDTVEANVALGFEPDLRHYGSGAQVLADLGISRMRLLSNNPTKFVGLQAFGLDIVERVPLQVHPTAHSRQYLQTKRDKMGHILNVAPEDTEDQ